MSGIAETTFFPKEGTRKVKEKKKKNEAQSLAYLRVGCKWLCIYGSGVGRVFFFSYLSRGFSFRKKLYSVIEFFLAFVLFLSHES